MFCPKCGEILRDNALRCSVCGASLLKNKATQINEACDCGTGKKLSFEVTRPRTHSTPQTGGKWSGKAYTQGRTFPSSRGKPGAEECIRLLRDFFLRYTDFRGRTSRRDFWLTWLMLFVITLALFMTTELSAVLWMLAVLVPKISMMVRRLHDAGKPGKLLFLGLIPYVGAIFLIVWFCKPSASGNQWGPGL